MIPVEICYASKEEQVILKFQLPEQTTVLEAILQSGLLDRFPEISLPGNVGIYGQKVPLNQRITINDRIEIYRLLEMTPNQLRLLRAKPKKASS